MAAFDPDADSSQDLALRLLATSPVTLFWRRPILDEAVDWLKTNDYQVVQLDAVRWETDRDLHDDIAIALDFPDYYGRNLDALNDCLRDVVDQRYGWSPDAAGLVLVFVGFGGFATRRPGPANAVLDILATRSRGALLYGRRLLTLVQTDDPRVRLEPVGALPVAWNDAEWLDADRQVSS